MKDLARHLVTYHRLAHELARARARLAGVPEEMQALHDEHVAAQAELDALAATADQARHERAARESAVAEAQDKLQKFQQQVPRVRNQREYGALLTEIDHAKSNLRTLEEAVLEVLETAESAGQALETRRAEFADLAERYGAALAEWEARKPEVAARAAELEREAAAVRTELPRGVIAQYERLADRYRGEALAEVLSVERAGGTTIWHCASCNYQVRAQVVLEIRTRGAIVQCDGCRRFLHVVEPA